MLNSGIFHNGNNHLKTASVFILGIVSSSGKTEQLQQKGNQIMVVSKMEIIELHWKLSVTEKTSATSCLVCVL